MGLAGRKEKQRIPNDPRNLSWADDAARFGQSYMSKLGWDPSKGLGASGDGMKSHLKVSQKLDMLGIGAAHQKDPHGIAWKQNKDFEALLQRLNAQDSQDSSKHVLGEFVRPEHSAADAHPEEDKEPSQSSKKEKKRKRKEGEHAEGRKDKKKRKKNKHQGEDVEDSAGADSSKPAPLHIDPPAPSDTVSSNLQTMPKGRPMAHRARIQAAKRLANKSAAAISEILGIAPTPSSVSCTTPSGSLTPITPADSELPLEKLTTSTKSVADYFKEKLGAKSGTNTPDANGDDGTSRGGIGSSAPSRDDVDQPRIGLGASRGFGEGGSSNVLAQFFNTSSLSHATVVQMASSATQAIIQLPDPTTSSTDNSRDEDMTEKRRRKMRRKEERKKRDAEVVDVPEGPGVEMLDNDVKAEKKKRKAERKAKGAEPHNLAPLAVAEESEEGLESERKRRKDEKKKKKVKFDEQATAEEDKKRSKKSKKRTENDNS
ncbi:hypothetical protein BDR04DRAFT_1072212 [Suillus decipiens]|nr:hypothetical protein BDR04DRAFT_1072212 [Suillus decipiens]